MNNNDHLELKIPHEQERRTIYNYNFMNYFIHTYIISYLILQDIDSNPEIFW